MFHCHGIKIHLCSIAMVWYIKVPLPWYNTWMFHHHATTHQCSIAMEHILFHYNQECIRIFTKFTLFVRCYYLHGDQLSVYGKIHLCSVAMVKYINFPLPFQNTSMFHPHGTMHQCSITMVWNMNVPLPYPICALLCTYHDNSIYCFTIIKHVCEFLQHSCFSYT